MKLYEIAADYENLLELIEMGEIPEEAIADTLESIEAIFEEKADNIACGIKNLLAEIDAIKKEKANLDGRIKAKTKTVERMKAYLSEYLLRVGYSKLETPRNKLSFRKSEKVMVDDVDAFIEWAATEHDDLLNYPAPEINKTAIKKALAAGETITGAYITESQNIQIK